MTDPSSGHMQIIRQATVTVTAGSARGKLRSLLFRWHYGGNDLSSVFAIDLKILVQSKYDAIVKYF